MILELDGARPTIASSAWIAPTATVVGDVVIGENASIWYGAVLRADMERIEIGDEANVQDGSVLHSSPGLPVQVGPGATVGHACVVHGAVLRERCLVGNGATLLDGSRIGRRSLVAANALVKEGFVLDDERMAGGVPATNLGRVTKPTVRALIAENAETYRRLAAIHRRAKVVTDP